MVSEGPKVSGVSGWFGGIAGGGQELLRRSVISDQSLPPHPPPPACLSRPLRLIQLDQDDTNNWLKLEPVCSPNDPYLTPFVAMVSLFPFPFSRAAAAASSAAAAAPFGMVYLGPLTSVLAQSPAEHNSR